MNVSIECYRDNTNEDHVIIVWINGKQHDTFRFINESDIARTKKMLRDKYGEDVFFF